MSDLLPYSVCMNDARYQLYYVHDPMCSWCWAFRQVWNEVRAALPDEINIISLLGGLAADSDTTMPMYQQANIRQYWQTIQRQVPGTRFNFDFWTQCTPRRSTYPACRAVIAAGKQGQQHEETMILAIQQAYYLQAKNPSDADVLIDLADGLGLDEARFAADLQSQKTQARLHRECEMARKIGAQGFPSLIVARKDSYQCVPIDYCDAGLMLQRLRALLAI
ncbi:MAG: DsbA family protein [Mariprofundaceae bacterium]|nr:DsbA family protein [Mariprofundaceae bacterium]